MILRYKIIFFCLVCFVNEAIFLVFVLAGENGTIDGQGFLWWERFRNKTLDCTRPHLVELMNSTRVVISNLTFLNSPFWTIHPVYCRFTFGPKLKTMIKCLLFADITPKMLDFCELDDEI